MSDPLGPPNAPRLRPPTAPSSSYVDPIQLEQALDAETAEVIARALREGCQCDPLEPTYLRRGGTGRFHPVVLHDPECPLHERISDA